MLIAPIVEGHGEVRALPRLLHRIAAEVSPGIPLQVNEPIRVKSGSFMNDDRYQASYVALAAAKVRQSDRGAVLVLMDCEDDCPATLGPRLLQRAQAAALDVRVVIVLAFREYETWFMAAAESLRAVQGLDPLASSPVDPEATRDAKGWLGRLMPHGYDPIAHQAAFSMAVDLAACRRVPSFARLCGKIQSLLGAGT